MIPTGATRILDLGRGKGQRLLRAADGPGSRCQVQVLVSRINVNSVKRELREIQKAAHTALDDVAASKCPMEIHLER